MAEAEGGGAETDRLDYNTIVEIHSLANTTQYNGMHAAIIRLPAENAEEQYGLCLKKGKQLLCHRKNLRVVTPFILNDDFWFSFSFLSNEVTVENYNLVWKASPFDQMEGNKETIDKLFYNTCRLMLPLLKGWLKQSDVLRHLVIYLDRTLAEYWMKNRPNEESLADVQYELLPHLLFGCHGNSLGSDYISKYDGERELYTTILWNKAGNLGSLEIETFERL